MIEKGKNRNRLTKKIKFALIMKDGKEVRNKEELKNNFDIYELMTNFIDKTRTGSTKLEEWLKDRGYQDEYKRINELKEVYDKSDEKKRRDVLRDICKCFNVSVDESIIESFDFGKMLWNANRADEIKRLTDDKQVLNNINRTVLNQEELEAKEIELGNEKDKKIFLLKTKEVEYYILNCENLNKGFKYIGKKGKFIDGEVKVKIVNNTIDKRELSTSDIKTIKSVIEKSLGNIKICSEEIIEHMLVDEHKYNEETIPYNEAILGNNETRQKKDRSNSRKVVSDELIKYMDAGFPLLYINTFEEAKADEIIKAAVDGRNMLEWNVQGFWENKRWKGAFDLQNTLNIFIRDQVSSAIKTEITHDNLRKITLNNSVLVLKDAHNLLKNDVIVAQLKYLAQKIYNDEIEDCNIIIISPVLNIPVELENYLTIIDLGYLTTEEIAALVNDFCIAQETDPPPKILFDQLVKALKGLSEFDIINILSLALTNDCEISADELELIREQKKRMIKKTNILQMIEVDETMESLGGLDLLKDWLRQKAKIFSDLDKANEFGVITPKGVLIAGMPGCGKSLCAKVTANMFNMPLLCLDMGRIMGKYVGESEANMRRALSLAEAISPCVLWIDEMEKAFSGIGGDGSGSDVTMRLFGTFLTWMQEKKSPVFVVATANDATKLPSELLRKGRFDELFYVNLPNNKERIAILEIHIKSKREADWINFSEDDIKDLAKMTEKYSGADIEGAVRNAVEKAFIHDKMLDRGILEESIKDIIPISKIKKDAIQSMRELYKKNNFQIATTRDPNDADNPREKVKMLVDARKRSAKERFEIFKNKYLRFFLKKEDKMESKDNEEIT